MSEATCKTCPAASFSEDRPGYRVLSSECRRMPPAAVCNEDGESYYRAWPMVRPDDWCGEHPARKPTIADRLKHVDWDDVRQHYEEESREEQG